jgi:Xaa-Pro aminopeptidase
MRVPSRLPDGSASEAPVSRMNRSRRWRTAVVCFTLLVASVLAGGYAVEAVGTGATATATQAGPQRGSSPASIPPADFQSRRRAAMDRLADGIVLLHANAGMKRWDEAYFQQDTDFYYFTGLRNAQSAILAIDGGVKESWLFVPPINGSSPDLTGADRPFFEPGSATEGALGFDHVVPWDELQGFIDGRVVRSPKPVIYLDSGGQTGSQIGDRANPKGLQGVNNIHLLWFEAIRARWPDANVRDAWGPLSEVRSLKSPAEIALLRKAAEVTAAGFRAGLRAIAPGKTQRQVEGAVVQGCLDAGSNGPSLWPWVQSGPNAQTLFEGFFDYSNVNRTLQPGGLLRLDIGCDYNMYKGDFGRTIPVSGQFNTDQRETLDLLTAAYMAGIAVMKEGATSDDVVRGATAAVQAAIFGLKSAMAKEAAASLVNNPRQLAILHGLGLDMADGGVRLMQAGNVICFEPGVTVRGDSFFVEDTLLITKTGHEILNPPLPYSAADIEKAMATERSRR